LEFGPLYSYLSFNLLMANFSLYIANLKFDFNLKDVDLRSYFRINFKIIAYLHLKYCFANYNSKWNVN